MSRFAASSLRQPLEERAVTVSTYGVRETIPSDFMFVGAANPCPCGNLFEGSGKCTCSEGAIKSHLQKITLPIIDRIDLQIPVSKVRSSGINAAKGENSQTVSERVISARKIQSERYRNESFSVNSDLGRNGLIKYCPLSKESKVLLERAIDSMGISMRAYEKVIKVARTIADIDARENIDESDIAEALQYRFFDRQEVFAV